MKFKEPRKKSSKQPETMLYKQVREWLEHRGWFVLKLHGSEFQVGLPDVYAFHVKYGCAWIELKMPKRKKDRHGGLRASQIRMMKRMQVAGVPVWVITSVEELQLLYTRRPNFMSYLNNSKVVRPLPIKKKT